jgi:hypothetical protein
MSQLAAEMDRQFPQRAGLVADPIDVRVGQQGAVHPAPAAGAHFQDQLGKGRPDRVLQPVNAAVMGDQGVLVRQVRGQARRPAAGEQIGVEVPFDPPDIGRTDDLRHAVEGVLPGIRHAQMQHGALSGRRGLVVQVVQPFRMLTADR